MRNCIQFFSSDRRSRLRKIPERFAAIQLALAFVLAGCAPTQRATSDSQIIREVEAAGSGPVENASVQSLFTWFEQHTHLANQINKQCEQAKKRQ